MTTVLQQLTTSWELCPPPNDYLLVVPGKARALKLFLTFEEGPFTVYYRPQPILLTTSLANKKRNVEANIRDQ